MGRRCVALFVDPLRAGVLVGVDVHGKEDRAGIGVGDAAALVEGEVDVAVADIAGGLGGGGTEILGVLLNAGTQGRGERLDLLGGLFVGAAIGTRQHSLDHQDPRQGQQPTHDQELLDIQGR